MYAHHFHLRMALICKKNKQTPQDLPVSDFGLIFS